MSRRTADTEPATRQVGHRPRRARSVLQAKHRETQTRGCRCLARVLRATRACGAASPGAKLPFVGTPRDGNLLLCRSSSGEPWAVVVPVKTSQQLHAVLLPLSASEAARTAYSSSIRCDETVLHANPLVFERDRWTVDQKAMTLAWTKSEVFLSDAWRVRLRIELRDA